MLNDRNRPFPGAENWLRACFWLACALFSGSAVYLGLLFSTSFSGTTWQQPRILAIFAAIVAVLILIGAILIPGRDLQRRRIRGDALSPAGTFLVENGPGLILALLFFAVYFSLAVSLLGALPDDNFYDTDSTSWLNRFTAPVNQLVEMRPVHPFAFLIFRPLAWFMSLFTAGSKFHAAVLLNAGVGALCVFLAWSFVQRISGNKSFALMGAALLGVTTSHLILSTALETYIYSAAALTGFLILVTRERTSLRSLVPAGLIIFGITLTNFVQTLILFAFRDFKILRLVKYTAIVLVSAVVLAFVQVKIYPTSQPFYVLSNMLAEGRFSQGLFFEGTSHAVERANALGRSITVFSVVAPRPLILLKETGCEFPCFQTYKHRWNGALMNSYAGLGSWLARIWFLALFVAGLVFARKVIQSPKDAALCASLLACVLFNFLLHISYGDDPMLYSGDWTYAVVFFVLLSFKDWADRIWFRAGLLVFLALLMLNNWRFLYAVMSALSPYFS